MKAKILSLLTVALLAGVAEPAKAVLVSYSTVGTFGGAPTFVDPVSGVVISFDSVVGDSVNVPPPSSVSFGLFNTTGTSATDPVAVSTPFELTITQSGPTGGSTTFTGTLTGTLSATSSTAFVQFDSPLNATIGDVTYRITEADNATLGRANLSPPSANNGRASVEGEINVDEGIIPEPSTLLMAGLGGPLLLLAIRRRQKRNGTA